MTVQEDDAPAVEQVEGEVVTPEPFDAEPIEIDGPDDDSVEEVRVRVRRTEIKDTEVYVRRRGGRRAGSSAEDRQDTASEGSDGSGMPAIYDEVLQDDFEVVDFKKRN